MSRQLGERQENLVRLARFERASSTFARLHSNPLSYSRRKNGRGLSPPPESPNLLGQTNKVVQHGVETTVYGDRTDLLGHLLQGLQLLETQCNRVVLHDLGRVEQ